MRGLHIFALTLMIIGGLNWGLIGLFNVNVVAAIFGEGSFFSRLIYSLVGLSALWGLYLYKPVNKNTPSQMQFS